MEILIGIVVLLLGFCALVSIFGAVEGTVRKILDDE